ncbi:aminoacyl-histidine dipeptidase [Clostridium sp. 19966]|uniref:aminoacyl-histidine dipeptidase n=1 Tax=Clostridium sp. 19966 TaxID=2768166 RepID=UPI0028DDB177|nr:aminoacyl-histidine dipeptidase [Clostridium sp. 19966]MDT8715205.1 aminoacyl-histidine dipeptidase [Clostridium sp. 19966]
MAGVLDGLKPVKVFSFFEEISRIPRGSGNEKGISDYLVSFAKERNLEVIQDEANNIIIKKNGSKGYENSATVIIQGHLDMVCEKNRATVHDFEKDPIELVVDGDFIKAKGTTLGGDDGIAVAYAMALLDSDDIAHPPIEVVLTTDEESGMSGVMNLKPDHINGRRLLNIDSEEEGQLLVSCAGGMRTNVALPIEWTESSIKGTHLHLRIEGLKGGHSGSDIKLERANANVTLGRLLYDIAKSVEFELSAINGGAKNNAIPRESEAFIIVKHEDVDKIKAKVEEWESILKNEYRNSDKDIRVELDVIDAKEEKVFSKETKDKAIKLLNVIPNGIYTMSTDIAGLVQSSTNIGVLTTKENEIDYDSAVRSSVRTLKYDILNQTIIIAEALGAKVKVTSEYPEWKYNANSELREILKKVYKRMYDAEPEVVAIHAGVECGFLEEKFGAIDMISFGPNIYDAHTPDERLSISSTERTWNYLLEVLKELK